MAGEIFSLAYNVGLMNGSSDTAEVKIYGEIIEDGPRWWKWSEEDKSAAEFDKAIKEIREQGADNLLLRINSPGGIVREAVAMRSILGNAGFDTVNIRIEGMCASAATIIATIQGAHVSIAEGSQHMIHNPRTYAAGTADEIESAVERLRGTEQTMRELYAKRTGQEENQIKEWLDAETWFTAKQAVEFGFADEVLEADLSSGMPIVACVSKRAMETMKGLYKAIPEQIATMGEPKKGPEKNNSNGKPSGIKKQNEEAHNMELNTITMDQLKEGNPELMQQIQQSAVEEERTRLADIDALTLPGYEDLAKQAKENGTSAADFQKQIVAEVRKKGDDFIRNRQQETGAANNIIGGAPAGKNDEAQEIQNTAKEIAAYASEYTGDKGNKGMY